MHNWFVRNGVLCLGEFGHGGFLGESVRCGIVRRIWLSTISLRLVVGLVPESIILGLPLLIIGGRLVGMVLLC